MNISKNKIVAIHQPSFFPWLGYFDKINQADIFVYLTHTLNNPRSANWYKRVKIVLNQKSYWLSLALQSGADIFLPLHEMKIHQATFHKKKHLKTLTQNYRKHPFYDQVYPLLESYYNSSSDLLVERNIHFIDEVCHNLAINTPRVRSSTLDCQASSTELLIEITKKLEANTYLAGGGASGYQEDEKFKENQIILKYQNFQHPTYPQHGIDKFEMGLSVIDALMNVGFDGVKKLLNSER